MNKHPYSEWHKFEGAHTTVSLALPIAAWRYVLDYIEASDCPVANAEMLASLNAFRDVLVTAAAVGEREATGAKLC